MKFVIASLAAVLSVVPAAASDSGAALAAVADLGQINGQALACGEKATVSRAKDLMLRHAPKTASYGEAFEQATQNGFLGQVKGAAACPSALSLAERLETVARHLSELLPTEHK